MILKKNNISLFCHISWSDNLLKICEFIFDNYKTNYISAFGLSHNNTKRPKRILQNILKVLDFFRKKNLSKKVAILIFYLRGIYPFFQ